MTYKTSKKYRLNVRDLLRGLFVAVGTSVAFCVQTSLDAGNISLNWKQIGIASVSAAFAYLTKNFFSESKIETPNERNKN